jgi:hypothetical protein
MARIVNGTLFVPSFTNTAPGEWTFTGATYANVADMEGDGTADLAIGFVVYVPANDINTAFPIPGVAHRYVLTAINIVDSSTIDGTILWDEGGSEDDQPNNGDFCIISEQGTGLGLGFPVSQQNYPSLAAGMDMSALAADARSILDQITGGGADKEYTEVHMALLTTADGDFATATGLLRNPEGSLVVTVNGLQVEVGDGVDTGCDCFFTDPSNSTPKSHDAITTGDKMRWNGSLATYELATTDVIQMTYEAAP